MKNNRITARSLVVGMVFAVLFAILTVYYSNVKGLILTATQIAPLPYFLLLLMVLLINPLCRLIRVVRLFTSIEILIVFLMGSVSSGLSTFGLTEQVVPIAGSLFNQEWNNDQSEWNRCVIPFVNEAYFVSEPGIQKAAIEYRQAFDRLIENKTVHDAAVRYTSALARQAEVQTALQEAEKGPDTPEKAVKVSMARLAFENARSAALESERGWKPLSLASGVPDPQKVMQIYPERIRTAEAEVAKVRQRLDEREIRAFEKVKLFRRGLPKGMQAYPGILAMKGDDFSSYTGRLRRLVYGTTSLRPLKAAVKRIGSLPVESGVDKPLGETLVGDIASAIESLRPIAEVSVFEQRKKECSGEEERVAARIADLSTQLKRLGVEKRKANQDAVSGFEDQIDSLSGDLNDVLEIQKQLIRVRECNETQLTAAQRAAGIVNDLQTLKTELGSKPLKVVEVRSRLDSLRAQYPSIDASMHRYLLGDIPWRHWVKPLFRWAMLIGLTYVILMALNILIFRQWAYNEKLTYPLAELPKSLVVGGEDGALIPPIYKSSLFWFGVLISGSVLGWSLFCYTNVVPGLEPLKLGGAWYPYLNHTKFQALANQRSVVFFTMVGLSFFIPKNVSFSLWFFYVVYLIELQLMVWAGYGQDDRSFPNDWWCMLNFCTAQGQGALMVFASVVLYKCRKYILCFFRPVTVNDLESEERKELKISSFAFLFGSAGIIYLLWKDMGASLWFSVFSYFVLIVITIGLIRAVTEGGLLSFQAWASPFHCVRAFFGLDKTWTNSSLFAPIIVYYSILFLDIKTFIAPAFANSLKIRDDLKMSRTRFHLAILLAIMVAAGSAIAAAIMMAYSVGADTMQGWFYTGLPKVALFDMIRNMAKDAPASSPSSQMWLGVGAVTMGLLLYFRQFIFWLPHPIGMIMLVNPLMASYWFSIFLGWAANTMVTKYGNQETFHRAKMFFVGLIVGELLMVVASMILTILFGMTGTVTLNR